MKITKKLNKGRIKLTKKNIHSGYIRNFINNIEGGDKVLSDSELIEERKKIISTTETLKDLHIFAYGSLLWNPTIDFENQFLGKVYGYHRTFCMLTKLGRGSYENPGLMLGLDKGGSCNGILYKLRYKSALKNVDLLFKREMVTRAYVPKILNVLGDNGRIFKALSFTVDRNHKNYFNEKNYIKKIKMIKKASGFLGTCSEYLVNTSKSLEELNILDKEIKNLMLLLSMK